jgi:hypothetical protein
METKLTLRMDSDLIDKAKKWARDRNVSLSQAISGFFESVTSRKATTKEEIGPWVRSLSIGNKSGRRLSDGQIREMHYSELERKHR